jgi:integrase
MQTGTVTRHGRGWRGLWREDGKRKVTATYERKGEAREALNREFDRIRLGDNYQAPITLRELSERFLAQYQPSVRTNYYVKLRLKRPLDAYGDAQASDLTGEALQTFLNGMPVGDAFRHDIMRALRMVYAFGVDQNIVRVNPTRKLKAPAPAKSARILPFESWAEVEAVAAEAGRWAPLIIFMADTGARPAEAVSIEHRHVDGGVVELPGTKTDRSHRTVHMTRRGIEAVNAIPRALQTRNVFHIDGRPISWVYFWREVWRPALELAQLPYRRPYNLRHTYAYWSLKAGVPIATVAREMGHTSTEMTFRIYGGWCREMGADAAAMREAWAEKKPGGTIVEPGMAGGA